jgi:thioredoxin-related protein
VEKTLFKKLATLLLVISSSNSIADDLQNQIDNIVLVDETKNSLMKQEKIIIIQIGIN